MKKSKRIVSATMAIFMATSIFPANGVLINKNIVEARTLDNEQLKAGLNTMKNLPQGLQLALQRANNYKTKLQALEQGMQASANADLTKDPNIISMLNVFKIRINSANSVKDVNKTVALCKNDVKPLVISSAKVQASNVENIIYEGQSIIADLSQYKDYSVITDNIINQLEGAIKKLAGSKGASQAIVQKTILGINNEIDNLGKERINTLKGLSNAQINKNSEVAKIINKINSAKSFEEIDNISLPANLSFNGDILKAKTNRRQEITNGISTKYSDYKLKDEVNVSDLVIKEDENNRDKWIVKGKVKNHIREHISIYYNGKFMGSGITDKEGNFEITLSEKVYDNSSLKIYSGKKEDLSKGNKISPWDIKVSDYIIEGKYYKDTNIKVYYKGKYITETRSDKDGKFNFRSDVKITNIGDLEFYKVNSLNDAKGIEIISANVGDNKIVGKSSELSEIIVKDKDNIRIGNGKADTNGDFTIFLNRALVNGEVITFTISEKDKDDINVDYTVSGLKNSNLNRIAYVSGYPNGNFKAGVNITRAEAATMFARLINNSSEFSTAKITKFEDAKSGWYAQCINYLLNKNLINGYPNGDFEPDSYITRAEFATMVFKYLNLNSENTSDIKDIKNHWAKNAIEMLYGNKIIKGYPDGTFKPEENITRAEAVTVLNAAFGRKSNINSMDNIANKEMLITFKDVRKSDWYYAEVVDASNNHSSYLNGDYEIWTLVK